MPQKMVSFAADCLSTIADENTVVASNVKRPRRASTRSSSFNSFFLLTSNGSYVGQTYYYKQEPENSQLCFPSPSTFDTLTTLLQRIKTMSNEQPSTAGLPDVSVNHVEELRQYHRLFSQLFARVRAGTMDLDHANSVYDAASSANEETIRAGNNSAAGVTAAVSVLRSALASSWYVFSLTSDSLDMEKINDSVPSHVTVTATNEVTIGEEGVENGVGDQQVDAVVFDLDTGFANRKASV